MNEKFKLSNIIEQVETGNAFLSHAWPWRDVPNPAHRLFFQTEECYRENIPRWGWYFMRVWITIDGKHGYLRDQKCQFDIDKDVPMQMLWDPLQEIYTMAKLADDPAIMGVKQDDYALYKDLPSFVGTLMYDERYLWQGYYSKTYRSPGHYERRIGY